MRRFTDLTERDVLALALSGEEEDGRVRAEPVHEPGEDHPGSARLAEAEPARGRMAGRIERTRLPGKTRGREDEGARRRFVPRAIRPGLAGLMDGSVPAPVSAAAFAPHSSHSAFLPGLDASPGAGISMGLPRRRPATGGSAGGERRCCAAWSAG